VEAGWSMPRAHSHAAIRSCRDPDAAMTRVATADGVVWFKECAPGQGFEPSLSAGLSARWPDRVAEVVAHDEDHGWLLMPDAEQPVREVGNPPELWLAAMQR
jgi:hypothetical protein